MDNHWTLNEALRLIRALQEGTRPFGYHLCLGGGVLNKGESHKDLDLFFLPLDNPDVESKPDDLKAWLEVPWGPGEDLYRDYGRAVVNPMDPGEIIITKTPSAYRHKLKFDYCGLRIDVFIS